jgi:hypothetical protein
MWHLINLLCLKRVRRDRDANNVGRGTSYAEFLGV